MENKIVLSLKKYRKSDSIIRHPFTGKIIARICKQCKEEKPIDEYYSKSDKNFPEQTHNICKKCTVIKDCKKSKELPPLKRFIRSTRVSARLRGLEFSLTEKDLLPLPEYCIYTGIKLDYESINEEGGMRARFGPCVDRIDSTKGYIPGNVQIISSLANRLKLDLSIEQLVSFSKNIIKLHSVKGETI